MKDRTHIVVSKDLCNRLLILKAQRGCPSLDVLIEGLLKEKPKSDTPKVFGPINEPSCSICNHPRREEIEEEVFSVPSPSRKAIAAKYEVDFTALHEHLNNHL